MWMNSCRVVMMLFACFLGSPASAANRSFTGNLSNDNEVQFFDFSIAAAATVTLRTYSYAGGANSAGTAIPSGGFDPILALFDAATGALIGQNDDGGCGQVPPDPATGNCWDTYLQASLPAGNYRVSVSQYDNFANGPSLSNGFSGYSMTSGFNGRTSAWAFDALNVDNAVIVPNTPKSVPTLSEWSISMLAGLLGVAGWRQMRRRARFD